MPKKKKTKTEILRRILDNPKDPEIKKSITNDDGNLESIRKRLSGEPTKSDRTERFSDLFVSDSNRLEPKVTVHKKEKVPKPDIKESETIPEIKKEPTKEVIIEAEDLFEIEKVDSSEPEFLQVSLKKEEKFIKKPKQKSINKEIIEDSSEDLPEWEPAEEPKFIPIIETVEEKEEISEDKIDEDKETKIEEKFEELPIFEEEKEENIEDDKEEIQNWEPIESDEKADKVKTIPTSHPKSKKSKQKKKAVKQIRIHHPFVILEMWAFTIIIGGFTISGLFLLRDWIFSTFGVYGSVFIPTPNGTQNIHLYFGSAFAILGVIHVVIHIFSNKKDILPVQTSRDFKAFLHSGLYLIGLARREEYGTSARYNGRQRIIYLCLVYILGLALVTGILYYFELISHDLSMVHVIPAGLGFMVLLFHFLITVRRHDPIALKGVFFTGKIPLWYVRKNHPIWYEQLQPKKGVASPSFTNMRGHKSFVGPNKLTNAIFTFTSLFDESPDETIVASFTKELQSTIDTSDQERIIELAEQLDSVEEEIDETGESTEEDEELEEASSTKEEKGEVKDTEPQVQEPADEKTISTEEKTDQIKGESLDLKEEEPAKQKTEESPSTTKDITDKGESKEAETKEELKEEKEEKPKEETPESEKEKSSEKKKDEKK